MPTGRSGGTLGEHTEKHPDQFNRAAGGWEVDALKGSLAWERGTHQTCKHPRGCGVCWRQQGPFPAGTD